MQNEAGQGAHTLRQRRSLAVAAGRRRNCSCHSPSASGFTLVELLIAFSLIGLITLLLFSGLRLGTRAWEGVEARAERTADLRVPRSFLERALTQARAVEVIVDGEIQRVFSGNKESLELAAPMSEHVGIPGLYVLRLTVEEGKHRQLILTRWLLHPDVLAGEGDIPEWRPLEGSDDQFGESGPLDQDLADGVFGTTLLLGGIDELEIAYFGIQEGDEDPDWYEDWLEQPRMPLAVRVHLTTPEQTWPDMLVRLPDAEK